MDESTEVEATETPHPDEHTVDSVEDFAGEDVDDSWLYDNDTVEDGAA